MLAFIKLFFVSHINTFNMLLRKFFLFFFSFIFLLQSSSQNSFQKDILFLTSNDLKGRYPGSTGDSLTQQYISSRFSQFDILPFINTDSYAQEFEYTSQYYFESTLQLKNGTTTQELKQSRDFEVTRSENNNIIDLECVFIGYGTDRSCLSAVKNKAVVTYLLFPLPSKNKEKRININDIISAGAKAIINVLPEHKNLPEHKKTRVYRHRKDNDSIIILSITKNHLDLFIKEKDINDYDSLAAINLSLLPSFIESTSTINLFVKRHEKKTATANIIGLKKGNNDDFIIIGGHHDHLGEDKESNLFYPGANDNASGLATLLYLAEKFNNIPLNCNLLFIAFAAEEKGFLGSKYFVENLPVKKENIRAMINLDVIGQLQNDTLYYAQYNNNFDRIKSPQIVNNSNIILYEKDAGLSDHIPFFLDSIPTLYFSTGAYKQLHSVEDTEELINYSGMNQTAELIFNVIKMLDNNGVN